MSSNPSTSYLSDIALGDLLITAFQEASLLHLETKKRVDRELSPYNYLRAILFFIIHVKVQRIITRLKKNDDYQCF